MKNKLYQKVNSFLLIALGLALITLGIVTSCESCTDTNQTETTEVVIGWDVTEPHQPVPEPESILRLYRLDTDPSRGAILRFRFFSDVQVNQETVFSLAPSPQNVLTNQFDRDREIEQFVNDVTAFLDSIAMDTIGREHSALYVPIATTANALASSSSDRKVLLLFSDLNENTSRISFYGKQTLALMQTDSAQVVAMLEAEEHLDQLSGIEVYVLYQPRDVADDASFAIVSRFYKGLFSGKGATVTVAANLNP